MSCVVARAYEYVLVNVQCRGVYDRGGVVYIHTPSFHLLCSNQPEETTQLALDGV